MLRRAVARVDRSLATYGVTAMDSFFSLSLRRQRLGAGAMTAFAGFGLLLAGLGIYAVIAYGAPTKAGTAGAHGAPLGEDEIRATKVALGWDPAQSFHVPDEVYERFNAAARGGELQREWEERYRNWWETKGKARFR